MLRPIALLVQMIRVRAGAGAGGVAQTPEINPPQTRIAKDT